MLDQNKDEEFESLVKELSSDATLTDYIDLDMDGAMPQSPIDVKSVAWRQECWQKVIQLIMRS